MKKNIELDVMFKHISANMSAEKMSEETDAYIAAAALRDDVPPLAPASADDNFFPSYVGYGKNSEGLAQALLDLRRAHPGGWSSEPARNAAPLEFISGRAASGTSSCHARIRSASWGSGPRARLPA